MSNAKIIDGMMQPVSQCVPRVLTYATLLWISGILSMANAASFFPGDADLLKKSSTTRAAEKKKIDAILASVSPDAEDVQLDDMIFKTKSLREKSAFSANKWPNNRVIYRFSPSLDEVQQQQFLDAAAEWTRVANVIFVPRNKEAGYIFVKSSSENSSFIGYTGTKQDLNIVSWTYKFVIAHEIGHALGLSHEHCRSDRDSYIVINWPNIPNNYASNFEINTTTNFGAYDFTSVMHYFKNAFAKNPTKNTMTPLPAYAEFEDVMGQTEYLSELDKQGMASYYGSPIPGGGKPDLTATWTELAPKITTKPSGVSARVDGRLNITNLGASDAGKFAVEIYLSADSTFDTGDLLLKKISMSTLLINKNVSKRVKAKLPKGMLPTGNYVIAVIDAKAAVSEATENNNIAVFGPL